MSISIAVVGVGHLGKEHARILTSNPEVDPVCVVDVDPSRAREIGEMFDVPFYTDLHEMIEENQPDAAVVAVPTEDHFEVAQTCLENNIHVLVEKPMTRDLDRARTLAERAQEEGVILQVGHVERFNPAVLRLREEVEQPRFIECDRLSPFRFRSADIDVILDVMIHDLDILLSLVPGDVESVESVGTPVITPFPDIVNVRIRFSSGCIANLSASRISLDNVRKLRVFTTDAYYSLDYQQQGLQRFRGSERLKNISLADIQALREREKKDEVDTEEIFQEYLDVDQLLSDEEQSKEPLALELEEFIRAVREQDQPAISGKDGVRAMELAEQIREGLESSDAPI